MTRLSRRRVLHLGAGAGALMLPRLAMPALAEGKPDELLIAAGGGDFLVALQKAYYDDFTKMSGIKVSPQPYKGLAELKVMVESQAWGQADLMLMSAGEAASAQAQGLSEPIDYGKVDRAGLMPGTTGDNWFLINVAGSVISWNTKGVPGDAEPKSWLDVFQPNRKGPRGFWKNASLTLDIAALGSGVPLDKLYPLDIGAAHNALGAIRDDIVWWSSGSQSQQLLAGNEVDTAMMWINRVDALRVDGKPVNYRFDQAICDGDTLVIPKGHPKKQAAMEFAAYIASPEPQARLVELMPLGPSNLKAATLASPQALSRTASDPKNMAVSRFQDFDWWAANNDKANSEFNKWLLG